MLLHTKTESHLSHQDVYPRVAKRVLEWECWPTLFVIDRALWENPIRSVAGYTWSSGHVNSNLDCVRFTNWDDLCGSTVVPRLAIGREIEITYRIIATASAVSRTRKI